MYTVFKKEELLTPEQVAELLNVSKRTIYQNAESLGGFYVFMRTKFFNRRLGRDIRTRRNVLRFRPEVINAIVK